MTTRDVRDQFRVLLHRTPDAKTQWIYRKWSVPALQQLIKSSAEYKKLHAPKPVVKPPVITPTAVTPPVVVAPPVVVVPAPHITPPARALLNIIVAWVKANPSPPTRPGSNWVGNCALLTYQSIDRTVGWKVAPVVTGPGAIDVARASGKLNKNWKAAPIGAFHFWAIGQFGHVELDLLGGGTALLGATAHVRGHYNPTAGYNSVAEYTAATGAIYLGWSTNYGHGVPNLPKEPV